jgi:hypothetical protein
MSATDPFLRRTRVAYLTMEAALHLPAALEKLAALGFGLPQHGDETALDRAINLWSD